MKSVNEKLKRAEQKILGVGSEHAFKGFLTKTDIIKSLNYYSVMHDFKDSKKWAIEWIKKTSPDVAKKISAVPDFHFKNIGFLCRMNSRGALFGAEHMEVINKTFDELVVIAGSSKSEADEKKTASTKKAVVIDIKPNALIDYFNTLVDRVLVEKIQINEFSDKPEATIAEYKDTFSFVLNTREDVKANEEFHIEDTFSRLDEFMTNFILEIQKGPPAKKTAPKAPESKAVVKSLKSPEIQTKQVKYAKKSEFIESPLAPARLVSVSRALVFDQKTRKLIFFMALNQDGFQFSGTSMLNIDLEKSLAKTVRKPEEFFGKIFKEDMSFIQMKAVFDSVTTKPSAVTGRFNDQMVILKFSKGK